jgi:hypothetical protein
MTAFERKVTEIKNEGRTDDGSTVDQTTQRVETSVGAKRTTANIVWYVYGFVAILLGMRFIMKLLGANTGNGFVDTVYAIAGVLAAPFIGIFGSPEVKAGEAVSIFEPSLLVAIGVYALIAWGIVKLMNLNERP